MFLDKIVNLIVTTDSYKFSHWKQFPEGLDFTEYYVESRGGVYDQVMLAGVDYICHILSQGVTVDDVEAARNLVKEHFGRDLLNYEGWMKIATELGGKLPLEIRSAPEGTIIPTKNVLLTVKNTVEGFGWLQGHFEPLILRGIWYPTTVATQSFFVKNVVSEYLEKTTDDNVIPLVLHSRLHDFGSRGASSSETAAIGGAAHLYNFKGTDTFESLIYLKEMYGGDIAGYSIPAREHSTTTIYLREFEDEAFLNSIKEFGDGYYACVIDSYDYEDALERITTGKIKNAIIASGGTFVIRPDSGVPVEVVMKALRTVEKNVGVTYNSKGYKVLHPSYRVIQGDGVDPLEILRILNWMEGSKYSAENIVFGMGGGLLQQIDRDTQRFAMKCSAAIIDGEYRGVSKDPKTDPGKKSKEGFLDLIDKGSGLETVSTTEIGKVHQNSIFKTYFKDGVILFKNTLEDVRFKSDLYAKMNWFEVKV